MALAVLQTAQQRWGEGKLQEMSELYAPNGVISLANPEGVWPELSKSFVGPSGALQWIDLIHKRFSFHDYSFSDYAESADKKTAYCSFSNLTADLATGKKAQGNFIQKCRVNDAGLIIDFTMTVLDSKVAVRQAAMYGITRTEVTVKSGSKESFKKLMHSLAIEAQRVTGFTALTGYWTSDESYVSCAIYDTLANAEASGTDPKFREMMSRVIPLLAGPPSREVYECAWHEGNAPWAGTVCVAVTNMYMKDGAWKQMSSGSPNGMAATVLQWPGAIGLVQIKKNDNSFELLAIYAQPAQAEATQDQVNANFAKLGPMLAGEPQRILREGLCYCGVNGMITFGNIEFADSKGVQAWKEFFSATETPMAGACWMTGPTSARWINVSTPQMWLEQSASQSARMEQMMAMMPGMKKVDCHYFGSTGQAVEQNLAMWDANPAFNMTFNPPPAGTAVSINPSSVKPGAMCFCIEVTLKPGTYDEWVNTSNDENRQRFDSLFGARRQNSTMFRTGTDSAIMVGHTDTAAFIKNQEAFAAVPPKGLAHVASFNCTIIGDVEDEVKAAMEKWEAMPFITVTYTLGEEALNYLKF